MRFFSSHKKTFEVCLIPTDGHKKFLKPFLVIILFSLYATFLPSAHATKTFKNCSDLNKVYKGGVALPGAVNHGGSTRYQPKYNKSLYMANKKSDRDNDGIACER